MLRSPWFWVIVLIVVLLLFGAPRLPGLAKSLGESMKIFRKEVKDLKDDDKPTAAPNTVESTAAPVAPTAPAAPSATVQQPAQPAQPVAPQQPASDGEGGTPAQR